jgi:hypothetical protein
MIAMLIGLCVGLIYLVLFMIVPKIMVIMAFILAFCALIAAAIILLVQPIKLLSSTGNTWNIIIGIALIIVAVSILIFYFCYQREIKLSSIFMYYANQFLKENFALFAYIPLFLVFSFGLVVLCIWQYVAFGTISTPNW